MDRYPKRLIEVDLPIKRISTHARREKNIRHGHISALHIWWARRPLAACRAVICASLWFDPADEKCPEQFRTLARDQMRLWARNHRTLMSSESFGAFEKATKESELFENDVYLRGLLLDFIADFANWDNSTNEHYLKTSRALTDAAHVANGGEPGTRPLVVDPFAGGGAIPLEALRIGADAFGSDLNPLAVLLNKVVLEYIPKYGQRLADEVRRWGAWVKDEAEKQLAEFYPTDDDGSTPSAYLWARTIVCEGPGCGAEIPMLRTNLIFGKGQKRIFLRPLIDAKSKQIKFTKQSVDYSSFSTVHNGKAICPICSFTTANESVMAQMRAKSGGSDDAVLLATVNPTDSGRDYRVNGNFSRTNSNVYTALEELRRIGQQAPLASVNPNRPSPNARGLSAVTRYGMNRFDMLYSPRQRLALLVVRQIVEKAISKVSPDLRKAVGSCLCLAFGRLVDRNSTLCRWIPQTGSIGYTFGRQALGMIWDFVEMNPLLHSGGWSGAVNDIADTLEQENGLAVVGKADQFSATEHRLPDDSISALISDPPYYDAIPYADLSDFFYVWLRPILSVIHEELTTEEMTPKEEEAIWNPGRNLKSGLPKDTKFYESQMSRALSEARRITHPSGIGVVVFAHKSTAGWEALLSGMHGAGWTVTASWPIDTERAARTNAIGTASLASSVHLVCRPRENSDGSVRNEIGEWRELLRELPIRIHEWMPRLAAEGVVGADAIFACLGPALEIFSRYSSVEKPNGDEVTLREYLEHVWAAVEKEALKIVLGGGDTEGFEDDARLTAIWFWVLKASSTGSDQEKGANSEQEEVDDGGSNRSGNALAGFAMDFDTAKKLCQGLGITMADVSREGGILSIHGNTATLVALEERERYLLNSQPHLISTGAGAGARRNRRAKIIRVKDRGPTLYDPDPAPVIDPVQPYFTGMVPEGDTRTLMQRILDKGETSLDRLHQSMLLFGRGQTGLLKPFLTESGVSHDERFWRLANALSALYPAGSQEKRWVDGVLGRKKGMGF